MDLWKTYQCSGLRLYGKGGNARHFHKSDIGNREWKVKGIYVHAASTSICAQQAQLFACSKRIYFHAASASIKSQQAHLFTCSKHIYFHAAAHSNSYTGSTTRQSATTQQRLTGMFHICIQNQAFKRFHSHAP